MDSSSVVAEVVPAMNKSLSVLGKCVSLLAGNAAASNVPYGDSALTTVLRESLAGNCKTVLVATVCACDAAYEQSLHTLRYVCGCVCMCVYMYVWVCVWPLCVHAMRLMKSTYIEVCVCVYVYMCVCGL